MSINQGAPIRGISNINGEQAEVFSARNLRKPAPDAQLPLLQWEYFYFPNKVNHLHLFASNSGVLVRMQFSGALAWAPRQSSHRWDGINAWLEQH